MTNPIIALTLQLIRFASTNAENVNLSADYCANWLNSKGVHTRLLKNQGLKTVIASVGEKGPNIILNGHLDVVPGKPKDFQPRIEGEKIFGRGSYDMLGAVAAMMMLTAELAIAPPNCRLQLTLVPDEETGGELGTGALVRKGLVGDIVICGEPTNLDIGIQAKGILQLKIEVPGVAAHGSRSWLGKNAILKAIETYKDIEELSIFKQTTEYFSQPSLNLAKIEAGEAFNQVPDLCTLSVDIRYLPGQNPQDILEKIKGVAPETTITIFYHAPPVETNPDDKYVQQLRKTAEDMLGSSVKLFGQDGTADTRFFAERGVPAVEFGPIGANHHGHGEYVEINSLYTFKDILKKFILSLEGDKS